MRWINPRMAGPGLAGRETEAAVTRAYADLKAFGEPLRGRSRAVREDCARRGDY